MYWTGDENAGAVCRTIERAAAAGAGLCVFPELAVTGFHRRIAEAARAERVAGWMRTIAATCARHAIAVAVGAPTFGEDGRIYNSQILVDERGGQAGVVEKKGLTAPEATFFARGEARPVVALQGRRCTAVICREIEDLDDVCAQFVPTTPEIIFWPGMMGPEDGAEPADPPVHVQHAQDLARRTGAHVIQSNWPVSLNYPDQSYKTGKSVVIGPTGHIAFALPQAQAGLAVFTLGESSYAWEADAA
jgi:omega-amidase